jgi:O-antigen/teichoic acid export membrane protein
MIGAMKTLVETNVTASRGESAAPAVPARPRRGGSGLRGGVFALLDQAIVSGTSFATSVFIGRLCSPDELGVYSLALSLFLFLRAVQGELVCSPYTIYSSRHEGKSLATYTGSALVHYAVLTGLSVLALLGLAALLATGAGPSGTAGAVLALAAVAPLLLFREYARQVSLAQLRLGVVLALDSAVAILQLAALAWLAWGGGLSVPTAYIAAGAAAAIACAGWFLARQQTMRVERGRIVADWRHNWSFGRWAFASFVVCSAASLAMPWFVVGTHGKAAAGLLAACVSLVNFAGMYVTGFANFLTPRAARAFASGGAVELRGVLRGAALLFLITLGVFVAAILLLGDLPVTLVYGDAFAGAAAVLGVLALHILVNSLGVVAGNGLWALERARANFAADVCTCLASLLALACLLVPLGVVGAALAMLAGSCTGSLVRGLQLRRAFAEVQVPTAAAEGGGP